MTTAQPTQGDAVNATREQIVRACELTRDFNATSIKVASTVVYGLPDSHIVIELSGVQAGVQPVVFGIAPDGTASS